MNAFMLFYLVLMHNPVYASEIINEKDNRVILKSQIEPITVFFTTNHKNRELSHLPIHEINQDNLIHVILFDNKHLIEVFHKDQNIINKCPNINELVSNLDINNVTHLTKEKRRHEQQEIEDLANHLQSFKFGDATGIYKGTSFSVTNDGGNKAE